ncbi:hypothetical protein [Azospirillum sp.]|uniref:hypothetical protein n=1 Tax=Azospirillum sp. TaxID=34012 RepID=UPI003D764526
MSELLYKRVDRILDGVDKRDGYRFHPYDLNVITEAILGETLVDQVQFVPFPAAPDGIIVGFVKVWTYSAGVYADATTVADVHYLEDLSEEWRNFVVCKELCQLIWVDLPATRVSDRHHLIDLAERLMSDRFFDSEESCEQKVTEDAALIAAMELLCPFEFREIMMKDLVAGTLSKDAIARRFSIPLVVVNFLFNPVYHDYVRKQGRARFLPAQKPRVVSRQGEAG